MTQIFLEDLDPIVVEKLQVRANRQGRSLIEELNSDLAPLRTNPDNVKR